MPSIFATRAQEDVSDRYSFLPTASILAGMRAEGWQPVEAQEQKVVGVRKEARRGFQKHMIRFAQVDALKAFADQIEYGKHVVNYSKPLATRMDIVVINSHDRTSGYRIYGSPMRLVCYNGLIINDAELEHISLRHIGFNPAEVIVSSLAVANQAPRVLETMAGWQDRVLTAVEKQQLAQDALKIRYGGPDGLDTAPIGSELLLVPKRHADRGNDLWSVWNVVQENLLRGGMTDFARTYEAHRHNERAPGKLRAVVSIDENLRINQELWKLAETYKNN